MDRLPVGQQDDAKKTTFHVWNLSPTPDAPVRLNVLANRRTDGLLNPFIPDLGAIGAGSDRLELGRDSHTSKLTELGEVSKLEVPNSNDRRT